MKALYIGSLLISFISGFIVSDIRTSANIEPVYEETAPCEIAITEETPSYEIVTEQPKTTYLVVCKLTAYCCENYPHICNDGDSTKTATGTTPTPGRTIAVDPTVIPYGSEVIIDGHTYIAEDCGGAVKGNRIDILFATHEEALSFGVQYAEVQYIPNI